MSDKQVIRFLHVLDVFSQTIWAGVNVLEAIWSKDGNCIVCRTVRISSFLHVNQTLKLI